jgi:hypothetical protein
MIPKRLLIWLTTNTYGSQIVIASGLLLGFGVYWITENTEVAETILNDYIKPINPFNDFFKEQLIVPDIEPSIKIPEEKRIFYKGDGMIIRIKGGTE